MRAALVVALAVALSPQGASGFLPALTLQGSVGSGRGVRGLVCSGTKTTKRGVTRGNGTGGEPCPMAPSIRDHLHRSPSPVAGVNEKDIPAFPVDCPNTMQHTIHHWSESEGAQGWALSLPDLGELARDLDRVREQSEKLAEEAASKHGTKEGDRVRMQHIQALRRTLNLEMKLRAFDPDFADPKLLGEGGEGQILLGKDLQTGEEVAIKIDAADEKSSLQHEFNVLNDMRGVKGFPQIRHFGKQMFINKERFVMVMDLLGASITDLWWDTTKGRKGLNEATSLAVTVQMLDLLEMLHKKGYVYRDVKPDNFLMSEKGGKGHICMVDMGIAIKHAESEETESGSSLHGGRFYGTCRYASVNAHWGKDQSYRDDIESLVYVLSFLVKGGLPWEHLSCDKGMVTEAKEAAVRAITTGVTSVPFDASGTPLHPAQPPEASGTPLFPEKSERAGTPLFTEKANGTPLSQKEGAASAANDATVSQPGGEPFGYFGSALCHEGETVTERLKGELERTGPCSEVEAADDERLCHPLVRDMHPAVAELVKDLLVHTRSLKWGELPDYKFCRRQIMRVYKSITGRDEIVEDYEWFSPSSTQTSSRRAALLDLF